MKKKILFVCVLGSSLMYAQRWESVSQKTSQIRKEVEVKHSYKVDLSSLRSLLKDAVETGGNAKPVVISLPTVEGKIEKFAVYSNPVMVKSLADKYQLGSYVGVGIDDPSKYIRFSTSPTEMQSMIIKNGEFQFIEPISTDKQTYGVFYKTKRTGSDTGFECSTKEKQFNGIKSLKENGKNQLSNVGITSRPAATKYRTYRLAISVTGEYTQYFMTQAGVLANATDDEKRAPALVAINNTMTRVNGVFEKEFAIKLLVQDFPNILYINSANDPYINPNKTNLELQETLTAQVGNDNYDIGHVFNKVDAGGDGDAGGIGVTCTNPTNILPLAKGSAYTQNTNPTGDTFDIDYVAHEMGHQLGGNHTFSNLSEGYGVGVEPGGGTTIMGYAGITDDNVQMNSDAYFHYSSINQVLTSLEGKANCGTSASITDNTAPTISPLTAYNIPKGTAYYLDATAVDAENDSITYNWEEYDSVDDNSTISGDSGWGYNTQGTLSRSWIGKTDGRRYFPTLPTVMSGSLTNKTDWETVSYIPRTLHYAVTVRDANALKPLVSSSETTVTVGDDGPFKFNGLTASSVLYNNVSNTIYWEVANTSNAPYNAANVKIDYTADNGTTWTDLVASTPNTGSYSAQMPSSLTGAVKFRISAIGNVFYAVSPAVTIGTAPTSTTDAPAGVSAIDTEIFKTTARIAWNNVPGATYSINYRKTGTANWSNATSTVNSVVLNNLEDETNYEVQVAAVVNSVPGNFSNNYPFKTKGLKTGIDYCILNTGSNTLGIILNVKLSNVDYTDETFRSYRDISENAQQVINLVKGNQYNLKVVTTSPLSLANYGYTVNAWIDYNRNGIFESTEKVMSSTLTGGYSTKNANIIVPANAYSGDKTLRMRVASNANVSLDNSCGNTNITGSIVDFSVKITDAVLAVNDINKTKSEIEIYPNPADTFVEVKNLKGKADYKIYSADGRLVLDGKLDGQRINVAGLVKGMYIITIKDELKTYNTKLIKK